MPPFWLPEPHTETCTRLPAPLQPSAEAKTGSTTVLFSVLSLWPHQLQNHQITHGSAPATDSNAACCPDAWRSLSLAYIWHSHLIIFAPCHGFSSLFWVTNKLQPLPFRESCAHPTVTFTHLMIETKAAPCAALTMPCLLVQTHVWPLLT